MDLLTNEECEMLKKIISGKSQTPALILHKFFSNDYIKLTKEAIDYFSGIESIEGFYKWIAVKKKGNITLGASFAELTFKGLWMLYISMHGYK